jgi:hypothetical protein
VISLATARARFPQRLSRMRASVRRVGFGGELMCWPPGQYPAGCPDHLDVPFAFKPCCFVEARRAGLESVLWMDASCIAIRPLEPLFDVVEQAGYLLFRNEDYVVGKWASDDALEALGVSREQAMAIPEVNAAALGLSMSDPRALTFLNAWHEAAQAVVPFRGTRERLQTWDDYKATKWNLDGSVSVDPRVRGHRHDQTVAGVLAHRLGMKLATEGLQAYSPTHKIRLSPTTAIVIDRRYHRPVGRLAVRARWDKHLGRVAHLLSRSGRPGARAPGV